MYFFYEQVEKSKEKKIDTTFTYLSIVPQFISL